MCNWYIVQCTDRVCRKDHVGGSHVRPTALCSISNAFNAHGTTV
jgi:hypothetical protein